MPDDHKHHGEYDNNPNYNPDNFSAAIFANKAVSETNRLLANGRGNLVNDIVASGGASTVQTGVARGLLRLATANVFAQAAQNAIAAMRAKSGNCGECAALAFCLLHCWRVGPIALCSSSNADHAFVLIKVPTDYFICDPWAFAMTNGVITNSGLGYYSSLSASKPIYANPNVVVSAGAPAFCPIDAGGGSVEAHDSMEWAFSDNQLGVQQLVAQPWVWGGI